MSGQVERVGVGVPILPDYAGITALDNDGIVEIPLRLESGTGYDRCKYQIEFVKPGLNLAEQRRALINRPLQIFRRIRLRSPSGFIMR